MKKYLVGIDIGGTTVKLGLFDLNGELLDKWEIETRKTEKGRYILFNFGFILFNYSIYQGIFK